MSVVTKSPEVVRFCGGPPYVLYNMDCARRDEDAWADYMHCARGFHSQYAGARGDLLHEALHVIHMQRWFDEHKEDLALFVWIRNSNVWVSALGQTCANVRSLRAHLEWHLMQLTAADGEAERTRDTVHNIVYFTIEDLRHVLRSMQLHHLGPTDIAYPPHSDDNPWCWRLKTTNWSELSFKMANFAVDNKLL